MNRLNKEGQMNYGKAKSPDRVAVEAALLTATDESPLTAQEVADLAGVDLKSAHNRIAACVQAGIAHRTNAPHRPTLYASGPAPIEPVSEPRRAAVGYYKGHDLTKAPPRGESSMRAYTLPSLVSGESVERRRPILMASSASTNLNARPL